MAQQVRNIRSRKRKGKIKFKQTARIVEKNDATRVARADTTLYQRMPAQMPRTVGTVFKVKIRKKQ